MMYSVCVGNFPFKILNLVINNFYMYCYFIRLSDRLIGKQKATTPTTRTFKKGRGLVNEQNKGRLALYTLSIDVAQVKVTNF